MGALVAPLGVRAPQSRPVSGPDLYMPDILAGPDATEVSTKKAHGYP